MAGEPDLVASILASSSRQSERMAHLVATSVQGSDCQLVVVGCGTSEHAAMGVAAMLRRAMPGRSVRARQAFEAALEPSPGFCLGISHEGETRATIDALRAATELGARTGLVTAADASPAVTFADEVVVTPLNDASWCHTVGYLSPIVAGAKVAARLAADVLDGAGLRERLREVLALAPTAEAIGLGMSGTTRLVVVGSGLDAIGARELTLKVEEGARMPAVGRHLETQLHGHLASADESCGVVVIVVDPVAATGRGLRARQLLAACRRLGMPSAAIVSESIAREWPAWLTSAGRLVIADPRADVGPTSVASTLDALAMVAVALQSLAIGLIHARGTNPDAIRREDTAYREAAAIAEGTA